MSGQRRGGRVVAIHRDIWIFSSCCFGASRCAPHAFRSRHPMTTMEQPNVDAKGPSRRCVGWALCVADFCRNENEVVTAHPRLLLLPVYLKAERPKDSLYVSSVIRSHYINSSSPSPVSRRVRCGTTLPLSALTFCGERQPFCGGNVAKTSLR